MEVCVPVVKGFQFCFCLVDVVPEPFVSESLVEEVEVELLSLDHSVPPITTLLIHAPPTKVRKTSEVEEMVIVLLVVTLRVARWVEVQTVQPATPASNLFRSRRR